MPIIDEKIRDDVKKVVFDFFAEECEVDMDDLNEDTDIIKDIEGDSLMFLELLEIFKKKYQLEVELKIIGKYVVKNPVKTIKELIDTTLLIIENGDNIEKLV